MNSAAFSCAFFLLFLGHCLASKQQVDIYENLWNNNMDIANKTLHLDFLVQMQNGSLQAERYVNFTLQDINYLLKVTEMLKQMSQTVKRPHDLSDFMKGRYNSYKSFADSFLSQYFLKVR
uniref:Si:ch1073-67j19.1 n=1 Tax=Astyanax mexicanus TaxID=7994 RepID=A0A8B9GPZ6_ASTMX